MSLGRPPLWKGPAGPDRGGGSQARRVAQMVSRTLRRQHWTQPQLAVVLAFVAALALLGWQLCSVGQLASDPQERLVARDPPRVALMFLARGPMPLEQLWREFFISAGQVEPLAFAPDGSGLIKPPGRGRRRALQQEEQQQAADTAAAAADDDDGAAQVSATEGDTAQQQAAGRSMRPQRGAPPAQEAALADPTGLAEEQQQEQEQQQQQEEEQQDLPLELGGEGAAEHEDEEEGTAAAGAAGDGAQEVPEGGGGAADRAPAAEGGRHHHHASQLLRLDLSGIKAFHLALTATKAAADADAAADAKMVASTSRMSPRDPAGPIARQRLYNVYMHTAPSFAYAPGSLFSGYQIKGRVHVSWGQFTVAEAERRLVQAALRSARNTRFVLLSESCTPLYPPHLLYLQLLADRQSRVNACRDPGATTYERWVPSMYRPDLLGPESWRKSSQWKSLIREHAEMIGLDDALWPVFEEECYSGPGNVAMPAYVAAQNRTWVEKRNCISDEHYIPTLLAAKKQDAKTTCSDSLTHTDWVPGRWSPRVHHAREVSRFLMYRLRKRAWRTEDCPVAEALGSADAFFRRKGSQVNLAGTAMAELSGSRAGRPAVPAGNASAAAAGTAQPPRFQPLDADCFLFARKFAPDALQWLLVLARDCEHGTGIDQSCLAGPAAAAS